MGSYMGCYSTMILTCVYVRPKDFLIDLLLNLRPLKLFLKKKSSTCYIKVQLWCHILAIVLVKSRAQPPHRKEIFPAVLTTQFLSILLAETKPTLPITDETSMDHS